MYSQGVASRMRRSSTPMSRSVSIVRWLVMCARGVSDNRPYFVTSSVAVPYDARKRVADAPAGPEPTTRTSVLMSGSTREETGTDGTVIDILWQVFFRTVV